MNKFYILDFFPYPSGNGLHVGHTVGYIATDVYARYMRQCNREVFHPFGFDSFGLPTEQYAIKTGKDPKVVTEENIKRFKEQLAILDLDLNWDAEVVTSHEKYYKWTQWIFLQLYNSWFNYEKNKAEPIETCPFEDKENYRLAYKGDGEVNWCEALGTVLSNDEVKDGKSERGGHPVIRKTMKQWFLRITPYKKRLKDGLEQVEWKGKVIQSNWIDNLHDIVFSRQRKWGEPFPIEGETDTMPSFAGSNWYFFRYLDNNNDNYFCDKEKQNWLPVDLYVGGAEHTTGHLLYSRFITKVLFDLGHSVVDEPFKKIINVGLMLGTDGQKMSKSAGNSVLPDDIVAKYGSDAFRLWISFIAPFEQTKFWKEDGLKGCVRFLNRLKSLADKVTDEETQWELDKVADLHMKVEKDIVNFSFNTAIPRFMTIVNLLMSKEQVSRRALSEIVGVLSPFCPQTYKYFSDKGILSPAAIPTVTGG